MLDGQNFDPTCTHLVIGNPPTLIWSFFSPVLWDTEPPSFFLILMHLLNCIFVYLAGVPARNEKFLACVASGKWVLHKSYFEACRQEGKFVQVISHQVNVIIVVAYLFLLSSKSKMPDLELVSLMNEKY